MIQKSPIAHVAPLNDPKIKKMADKYGVTVSQLCIRYDWQLNCVVLIFIKKLVLYLLLISI